MQKVLSAINGFVWGLPALALILVVGGYLSIATRFAQFRFLPEALKAFWRQLCGKGDESGSSSFRALCTALGATVGTGNIAGVAGAISLGGPGSIFWMWICAFLGMIIKFAEASLAVRYRKKNAQGEFLSGPMFYIEMGLGKHWKGVAGLYAFLGVVAAMGVGTATQVNAVTVSIQAALGTEKTESVGILIGCLLGTLTAIVLLGEGKRVGNVAELLVPLASVGYIALSLGAILFHIDQLGDAVYTICKCAFDPKAATGGVIGSAFIALKTGAARGIFSNEAGMGTAAIAHGSAGGKQPAEQGLMGIIEVFLDTVVICTLTALVILTSPMEISYGKDMGAELTVMAFRYTYGSWISILIAVFLICFAFATMIGWGLYGIRCLGYLLPGINLKLFAFMQAAIIVVSTLMKTGMVWMAAETINGLMAIPNLAALAVLAPKVTEISNTYFIPKGHRTPALSKNRPTVRKLLHAQNRGNGSQESFHH